MQNFACICAFFLEDLELSSDSALEPFDKCEIDARHQGRVPCKRLRMLYG